jgi:phage terminase small subunit
MLTLRQSRFVEEYLIDLNGKQAAIRVGYSAKTAEVQAARLLGYVKVRQALQTAIEARSKRTEITADRVVVELARIAFANIRDYWPKEGETLDLHRLDQDRTAAVEKISIDEAVDRSGVLHRRTRLTLCDKLAALASLARHLGMFANGRLAEGGPERRIMTMTSGERLALADELPERATRCVALFEQYEREHPPAQIEGSGEGQTSRTQPHRPARRRHA